MNRDQNQLLKGILVLNKPQGMTSHDCIYRIRRIFGIKKVGHTGTLDPEVTGVLPICIGQATRVAEYLLDYDKEYIAEITIGRSTTTEDQAGETVEEVEVSQAPTENMIRDTLRSFVGEIEQIPPMYSAIKVKGVPLYQYARKGQHIERQSRKVRIYENELLTYTPGGMYPTFTIRVRCSKGTYIRTLGVDIAKSLGYPGHLSSLVRSKSGPFTLEEAVTLEEIERWNKNEILEHLKPMDKALQHLPIISLDDDTLTNRVINGQTLVLEESIRSDQLYRVYNSRNEFFALCKGVGPAHIKPKKVFK